MGDVDIVETLRGMAEGRTLLNVRHGVATPAGLLAKAADEIERLRALSQNNAHSWDAIVKVRDDPGLSQLGRTSCR